MLIKALRILAGSLLIALCLYAANLAVLDCRTGAGTHDNCLWLWLRGHLGLPQSRLARAASLEAVGLGLLAGIYLTFRYVLPLSRRSGTGQPGNQENSAAGGRS